jgi:hypothetical protein
MVSPRRSKEVTMCHGAEWEILKQQYADIARRNREKADADRARSKPAAPPKPAEVPARNEEPVPV